MKPSELRELVEKIKYLKSCTTEKVAKSIGYSRVHLQKEMAKKDSPEFISLLMEKHKDILQDVSFITPRDRESEPKPEEHYVSKDAVLETINKISRSNDKLIDQQAALIATNSKLADKLLSIDSNVPVEDSIGAKALLGLILKLGEVGVEAGKWKNQEEAQKELGMLYTDYVRARKGGGKQKLVDSGSSKKGS